MIDPEQRVAQLTEDICLTYLTRQDHDVEQQPELK